MDPERPSCGLRPRTVHPSHKPGLMPLPIFLPCDSATSWDLCTTILGTEKLDSWENSFLWDGGSLLISSSSQGHPDILEGAGSIFPQSPRDPSRFPLAQPWDGLSVDIPIDTSPDFAHSPVTAARLENGVPCPTSRINPGGVQDLDEVLAHVSHILSCHPKGMRVKRLVKALLKERGVNLWAFSWDNGYQGIVSFLQEVPGIQLWKPEKGEKCHVLSCTFKKDVTDPLPLLCSTLGSFPHGLRVFSLRKAMWQRHGVDLEEFSQQRGYMGTLDYLTRLPEVRLQGVERGDKCLVLLQTGVAMKRPAPQFLPNPVLSSALDSSTPNSDAPADPLPCTNAGPMENIGQAPSLAEVLSWVQEVLGRFPLGLKVGKLKEALRRERGLDLEALSRQQGCEDALGLLRGLPHLQLQDPGKGDTCLAKLGSDAAIDLIDPAGQQRHRCLVADAGTMALLIQVALAPLPQGMRVKKLTEALEGKHGVDLEAFSRAKGYEDVASFLGDIPGLTLQSPKRRNNCLVQLDKGAAEKPPTLQCSPDASVSSALDRSTPQSHAPADSSPPADVGPMEATGQTPSLAEVSYWVQEVLGRFPLGLKVGKLKEALRRERGLDLEALSSQHGCEDALGLLRGLPHLQLQDPGKGNTCLAQLGTGLAEVSSWVQEVLGRFPLGLKVGKLKEALRRERGLDLEALSRQHGCEDALGLLRGLPHLQLQDPGKGDSCLTQLGTDAAINLTKPAGWKEHHCLVADAGTMALLIQDALAPLPRGLRVKKLMETLEGKHGVDLEAFSQAKGHKDVVSFLKTIPRLLLRAPGRGNNCLVQLQRGSPHSPARSEKPLPDTASSPWAAPAGIPLEVGASDSWEAEDSEPAVTPGRGLTEVLGLLKHLLSTYQSGLRLKKVQEFLLERHGLDLEEFVNSQGYEDMLAFLQCYLPALEYRKPEQGKKCIIWLRTEQKGSSRSLLTGSTHPLSSSKRLLLPTNAPESPASPVTMCLNPLLPSATSNRPLLSGLPSGQQPLCAPAILGKLSKSPAANPCLPAWLLSPPQPSVACSSLQVDSGTRESKARPVIMPLVLQAEEGTQESGVQLGSAPLSSRAGSLEAPVPQCSDDLVELKRKVGSILAEHPEGMSLFQFRAAYSATHQHPLPLGHTASTKQWLAEMPDVVRIQGCGVQTLLLPVDPDEPPEPEPGLTRWILQEPAALAGDPNNIPAELLPTLAEAPSASNVSDLAGDPHTQAKPPTASTDVALASAPDALVKPPPASAVDPNILVELPPGPTGPALAGDLHVPAEHCPAPSDPALAGAPDALVKPFPAPTRGLIAQAEPLSVPAGHALAGDSHVPAEPHLPLTKIPSIPQTLLHPEAYRPEASWELPGVVPAIPRAPSMAAQPIMCPPACTILPAHAGLEPSSWCPLGLDPSLVQHKRVQVVSPFQGCPWARDASCTTPQVQLLPEALDQNQDMPAAVGLFPAMQHSGLDPAQGQAISTTPLPLESPGPLPAPGASVSGTNTPSRWGWPQTGCPKTGGDVGSPFKSLPHCSPDHPIPAAGRTQPDSGAKNPSAPQAPSQERFCDNCTVL